MQTIRPQMIEILGTKEMTAIELSHEGLGDVLQYVNNLCELGPGQVVEDTDIIYINAEVRDGLYSVYRENP